MIFKDFFQNFCGIFQECNPKSSPKGVGVVHVIVFAPNFSKSLTWIQKICSY
jgi:hypothetical protein